MMKLSTLACAAGLAAMMAWAPSAEAQEIQLTGPLKGAPSVREMRMYREGRFSLEPGVAFTLLEEYRRAMFVGGKLRYNFKEWISVDVWGAYALGDPVTNLTTQIDQTAPRDVRTAPNVCPQQGCFADQVSKMTWVVAPEVTFIPFRGKLSIFEKIMVDTDAFLYGGAAFVGVEERGECGGSGQPSCSAANPARDWSGSDNPPGPRWRPSSPAPRRSTPPFSS